MSRATTFKRKSNWPAITKQLTIAGSRRTAALNRSTIATSATCGQPVRLRDVGDSGLAVSIVTAAELRFGAAKSGSLRLQSRVAALLDAVDVLPFDVPADAEYANIRIQLESLGQSVRTTS